MCRVLFSYRYTLIYIYTIKVYFFGALLHQYVGRSCFSTAAAVVIAFVTVALLCIFWSFSFHFFKRCRFDCVSIQSLLIRTLHGYFLAVTLAVFSFCVTFATIHSSDLLMIINEHTKKSWTEENTKKNYDTTILKYERTNAFISHTTINENNHNE